jgi:type 2 lantibiotic biosynthesis protein LanM
MPLSRSDLRAMVAAASTIPERLSGHFLADVGQGNSELVQERLRVWCQVSAAGNWQRFERRLARDRLDLASAQRLLEPGYWSEQVPLPDWTTTLQDALQLLETMSNESTVLSKDRWPFLDVNMPLPFEELLAPFVGVAYQCFMEQSETASHLLTDSVYLTLQRHLLQVLTSLSVQTLHAELTRIRAQVQTSASTEGSDEQIDEQSIYQHFLQQMCQGGMAAMLRMYSVLARLLSTTCDFWVEANVEFVQRLQADWTDLQHMFSSRDELGQVTEIHPALSDVHAGRRAVMRLTFAPGCQLIYKPRAIGIEETYYRLLDRCNAQGATPRFQIVKILNRSTYGWMEYITQEPCQDGEGLLRYYQRAGMQLCLIYLLGGVECFYDQFIAHGEQPVLVDASHLLQPYFSSDPQNRQEEDWQQARYSVLQTGLLASWHRPLTGSHRSATDVSGLGVGEESHYSTLDTGRMSPSQPSITLKYGYLKQREPLHIATFVDTSSPLQEEELHEAICQGFERMYQLLLQQQTTLLADAGPFQAFKTQLVNVAYRGRAAYDELLPKLLAPQALRNGVTRSMLLEPLGLDCVPIDWFRVKQRDRSRWWVVFAAERQELLQGDIPRVSACADREGLQILNDQVDTSYLCPPAFDLVQRRIERLSDEEMARQLALLRYVLNQQSTSVSISRGTKEEHNPLNERPEILAFQTQALAIADDLARHAIEIAPGSVTWVYAEYSVRSGYRQLQPMRYGLSDGISGIAFFLAALAWRTGIASYRRLAHTAVRLLGRLIRQEGEWLAQEMGLGAGLGLGSLVYALTRISRFLDEPELLTDARAAASLISKERIAEDHLLDVFVGTAGAILGLLALYEVAPEQETLDRAVACGEHLLRSRTSNRTHSRAWPTLGGRQTTGFAHGAAGIVYALLRLYAVTKDTALLEAAQEGIRYEDHALSREMGNWVEEVGGREPSFGISWCHGAPGIGLARLGGLSMLDTASIRQDIEIALQTTQQIGTWGLDHLCCGTCGRIELLSMAAQRLERPELADVAAQWARQVISQAEQQGTFVFDPSLPRWVPYPQLWQGISGIGYTLLRLAQPGTLPSLLLWE